MGRMSRASQLMTSDIARLLDRAENPALAIEQLIGDLEESIVDLRRETVTAVARQSRLRKQLVAAAEAAGHVEREAQAALARGEELRARHTLSREIRTLMARDTLESELVKAKRVSAGLVASLIRLEDRAQLARRKQDELVRHRAGRGRGRTRRRRRGGDPLAAGLDALEATPSTAYAEAVQRPRAGEASRTGG